MIPYSKLRDPANRMPLADVVPLPHPLTLYIEPTDACCFACKYCPHSMPNYHNIVGDSRFMPIEFFRGLCDQIKELGRIKHINLHFMGEPLLHPDIAEMASRCKELADGVTITTNGALLTEAIGRKLISSGLDYLRISVYAVSNDRQKYLTGSNISVERIFENASRFNMLKKEMNSATPFFYVKMIRTNTEEDAAFLDMYRGVCDEVALEDVCDSSSIEGMPNFAQIEKEEMLKQRIFQNPKKVCSFPFYQMIISADGLVVSCCTDWSRKNIAGDLNKNTLREIWNGETLNKFRLMLLRLERSKLEACKNCTFMLTNPDNIDTLTDVEYERRVSACAR